METWQEISYGEEFRTTLQSTSKDKKIAKLRFSLLSRVLVCKSRTRIRSVLHMLYLHAVFIVRGAAGGISELISHSRSNNRHTHSTHAAGYKYLLFVVPADVLSLQQ